MKLVVSYELDVDEQAWANEYGLGAEEVREDVRTYLTTLLHDSYPSSVDLVRSSKEVAAHTWDAISTALNEGADTVRDGLDLGDRDMDLLNLVVNTQAHALEHPGEDDLDAAIKANYEEEPGAVRGWWDW